MRSSVYQTPTQNFAYADVDGDIGFISPGLLPTRKSGDGLAPVDGASGDADWTGDDDLRPGAAAPQSRSRLHLQRQQRRSSAPISPPTYGRDWEETFRARRIQQFFDANAKLSLDLSAAMQADHLSLDFEDLLPFLKRVTPSDERARQALALLAAWNGVMDKDRPEPLIYTAFLRALHRIMLVEKTGLSMSEKGPFAAETLIALLTDHPEWCDAPDHPDPDCRATLGRALDEGLAELVVKRDGADMSQWRWGREHVALLQHKVYSHIPLLDRISDLSMPVERRLLHARSRRRLRHSGRPAVRAHPGRRLSRRSTISPTPTSRASSSPPANPATSSRRTIATWRRCGSTGKSITLAGDEDDLKRAGAQELTFTPQ